MGSACAKAGVAVIEQTEDPSNGAGYATKETGKVPPGQLPAGNPSLGRRASERRGLRHGLVHAGRRVWDHYSVEKEIGHGMTGKVYLVRSRDNGELYALKSMDLRRLDVTSHELLEDLKAEVETLRGLDHPHVIKLYEYFVEPATGGPVQSMYLVLEYCSGGELFDRLHAQPGSRFTEVEAAYLINQMVAAVAYIHSQGITHRDLKLENFIFTDNSDTLRSALKLIDFGLSARYQSAGSGVKRMTTLCGTPYYLAPEVLNQSEGGGGYTNSVDEWSLGVITYMLLSGTPPFKGRRDREVLQAVRRGKYTLSGPRWEGISEDAKDFIRRLLVYNPAKRSSSEQAMKHPWLVAARARVAASANRLDEDIVNNLREYRTMTAFKRAALEAIAFSMSTSSLSQLREAFAKVDVGGSGCVNLGEFSQVLREAGLPKEEAAAIFRSIAPPNASTISYSEFLAASMNKKALRDATIRAAFSRLDVDGSGMITRESLRALMGDDWSAAAEDAFFAEADQNRDGVVSADEFMSALTRAFGPTVTVQPPPVPSSLPPEARAAQPQYAAAPVQMTAHVAAMPAAAQYGAGPSSAAVPSHAAAVPPHAPGALGQGVLSNPGSTGGTPDIETGTVALGPGPPVQRNGSRHLQDQAGYAGSGQAGQAAFAPTGLSAKTGLSFRVGPRPGRSGSDDDVRLLAGGQGPGGQIDAGKGEHNDPLGPLHLAAPGDAPGT